METCRNCGTSLTPKMSWCPRCFEPRDVGTRAVEAGMATTTSVQSGPAAHALTGPLGMRPGVRIGSPGQGTMPVAKYSGWRGGATTFGPAVKIVVTLLVAWLGYVTWYMSRIVDGSFVIIDMIVYIVVAVFFLRHVWRIDRVA